MSGECQGNVSGMSGGCQGNVRGRLGEFQGSSGEVQVNFRFNLKSSN